MELRPRIVGSAARDVDVAGHWVCPGFLDVHTHYDAEIEGLPGLEESVRQGVTTVVIGNCSLSAGLGDAEDLLDLFCRVENLPRVVVAEWLRAAPRPDGPGAYLAHLEQLPLGPNVAALLGHSSLRAHVMGLERSARDARATSEEPARMTELTEEAMKAGYTALSVDPLPWHRLVRRAGVCIPSQRACLAEYAVLADVVRRHRGVLQATPNAAFKLSAAFLFFLSAGLLRAPLKLSLVALLDLKGSPWVHKVGLVAATLANAMLRAQARWQVLPTAFAVYADGANTPLFEEFAAGVRALDAADGEQRRALFQDKAFCEDFLRDWRRSGPRNFPRDLEEVCVLSSTDSTLVGKSIAEAARERGMDPLDLFVERLGVEGDSLRWRTVTANHRKDVLRTMLRHHTTLPGFTDSGAHNRNMAYHDGALKLLRDAVQTPGWMSPAEAVARLTRESAEWFGISTGSVAPGARADVVVIDPQALRGPDNEMLAEADPRIGGVTRMVPRGAQPVRWSFIGGKPAVENGALSAELGRVRMGAVLRRTGVTA